MNTPAAIEAITRLLDRKQAVPSKMIRDLATDCKVYYSLSVQQAKRIAELEAENKQLKEGTK
jgi:hypothetical protein